MIKKSKYYLEKDYKKERNEFYKTIRPKSLKTEKVEKLIRDTITDWEDIEYILCGRGHNFEPPTYLKKQNTVGGEVIAILNQLPPELKLQDYIDYDKQFEKSFIEPMKSVMGAAGWQTEHVSTLENFFG